MGSVLLKRCKSYPLIHAVSHTPVSRSFLVFQIPLLRSASTHFCCSTALSHSHSRSRSPSLFQLQSLSSLTHPTSTSTFVQDAQLHPNQNQNGAAHTVCIGYQQGDNSGFSIAELFSVSSKLRILNVDMEDKLGFHWKSAFSCFMTSTSG